MHPASHSKQDYATCLAFLGYAKVDHLMMVGCDFGRIKQLYFKSQRLFARIRRQALKERNRYTQEALRPRAVRRKERASATYVRALGYDTCTNFSMEHIAVMTDTIKRLDVIIEACEERCAPVDSVADPETMLLHGETAQRFRHWRRQCEEHQGEIIDALVQSVSVSQSLGFIALPAGVAMEFPLPPLASLPRRSH